MTLNVMVWRIHFSGDDLARIQVSRDAQYYVLGALGVGLVFYIVQLVTEREAMRKEPGQG